MLIDEAHISIKAGDGGNGIVHFFTNRLQPHGGPDGGDGGTGGSVYFKAVSNISRLQQFRHQKKYAAENGQSGGPKNCTGHNGEDLILEIPVGSVISYDNGTKVELNTVSETYLAAKGGRGGKGNFHFRSSTNQTPQQHQSGRKAEVKNIFIQLKLIADVGLIGLPNTGKTSLLNELTSANAKVANYAFTTLEPNLGVTKGGQIIADIPGLIEGASSGKGLGYKFLKHIERTRVLVHCISADSTDPMADYKVVRQELANFSSVLVNKPEIIIITKSDLVDSKTIALISRQLKAKLSVSIIDTDSLKKFNDLLALS
jgi:GTPase